MEEVAVVSPMVAAAAVVLDDNNGAADDAASSTAIIIPSGVTKKANGDVPTIIAASATSSNDEELFATPVSSARSPSTRKKRGAVGLFRAMFVSFGRSDSMTMAESPKKKRAIAAAADDDDHIRPAAGDETPSWKVLVDGMRPLRLRGQELVEYYPPPPPLALGQHADVYHDAIIRPPTPARSGFEFEEVGMSRMTSRYTSAEDLHLMDNSAREEDDAVAADEGGNDGDGDSSCPHAIDMQAEEFIAKFYEQFKSESFKGCASE